VARGVVAAHAEDAEVIELTTARLVERAAHQDRGNAEIRRVEDHLKATLGVGH